jgi:UDP-N-acetyl-D-mannosaminuronic acid dehydrogenase
MKKIFFEITQNLSLGKFITDFEKSILKKKISLAIKLNKKNQIIGVITRGDLRRIIYKNRNFNDKIDKYLNYNPILIKDYELDNNLFSKLVKKSKGKKFDDIFVVDKNKKFLQIIKYEDLIKNYKFKKTCIIGMGHIGIPLAIHALKRFKYVVGYDNDKKKIDNLRKYELNFHEKNLDSIFKKKIKDKNLNITNLINKINSEVYIICIGSSFDKNKVNNINLKKIAKDLSKIIKKGDLIILRGTVSVGVSRQVFLKCILKFSKLKNGVDFYFAYMPERLVEGNALEELENIPCLISGSSEKCLEVAYDYSKELFRNVIKLDSLEEGEIVKLTTNSYRALNFTFSNEISRIANLHGLSGSNLIEKANFGYNRNSIAKPGLGIGGFCLPKDPILFSENLQKNSNYKLGTITNDINKSVTTFFADKFTKILKNIKQTKKVLIMGISFKGLPETIDIRNSTSLEIIKKMNRKNIKFHGYDPLGSKLKKIIKNRDIKILGKKINVNIYDMIIIVNDHPNFYQIIESQLKENKSNNKKYIFDTWNKLSVNYIKNLNWQYLKI